MSKITINPTFKKLIPPLSKEEREQLELNIIVEQKIRDPLVLWGDTLVDGHNRLEIAKKYNLEYKVERIDFENEDIAKYWIISNQLGRRNLPPYMRIELAKLKESEFSGKAKEKQAEFHGNQHTGLLTNSTKVQNEKINTRKELADIAGVSEDTMRKGKYIIENATEEMKQDLREGKKSIHAAYTELKAESKLLEPDNINDISDNPSDNSDPERELTSAEITFGTGNRPKPKDIAAEREIAEQVKLRAEHARTHKRTVQEFYEVFAVNANKYLTLVRHQINFMDNALWADRNNVEGAFTAIDGFITKISKLKEELNAKFEAQQSDNPTDDPGGIPEGSPQDSHGEEEKSD